MAVDINRGTAGIQLNPAQAAEVWANAAQTSAVMQLATKVTLPGSGVSIPVVTGEAEADWVNETEEAPVSRPTFANKIMTPYKASVIVPISKEFTRDKAALYNEIVSKLPSALARKFDATVFGLSTSAPGPNFDTLGGATQVGIAGETYAGLVAADQAVASGGGLLNGWALSPQARGILLGATDNSGRPLFLSNATDSGTVAQLLGAPVSLAKGVYSADADGTGAGTAARLGFAGDWTSAHYGIVEDVEISISTEATINDNGTQLNLWQRGMVGVKAEFEVGFVVRDVAHFALLTDGTQA